MNPRLIVPPLVALMLAGCAAAPRSGAPASPVAQPAIAGTVVVFPVAGDSGEVLSTIAEPVVRARSAPQAVSADSDTTISPSDTASDPGAHASQPPSVPQAAAPPPTPVAEPAPAPPPAAKPPAATAQPVKPWIQLFAGNSRATAFSEAQRAVRQLSLREEEVQISQDAARKLWRVRMASSATYDPAALRRFFPRAFSVAGDDLGPGK